MTYVEDSKTLLKKELPGLDGPLLDLYVLLALTTGEDTTLEHVHDAWSVWQSGIKPDHRSIVPFVELTVEVQELDRKYAEAIRAVSAELKTRMIQS